MTTAVKYELAEFIHDMSALVDEQPDQERLFDIGSSYLERLVVNPEAVPELAAERAQTRVKVPKRPPPKGLLDRLTPDFLASDHDSAGDTEAE